MYKSWVRIMLIIYSKISVVLRMNHGRSKLSTSIMMIRAFKTKTRRSLFGNFTNTNKSVSKRRCLCLVSERYWIHPSLNVNKMADEIWEQSTNNCSNITNTSTNTLYIERYLNWRSSVSAVRARTRYSRWTFAGLLCYTVTHEIYRLTRSSSPDKR